MKLTHPCKDTCSGYSQDCVQQVEALESRVRELEAENIDLKSCPNESWECQKYQRKLEAENALLRKVVDKLRALTSHHRGVLINSRCTCTGCHALREFEELNRAERGGG